MRGGSRVQYLSIKSLRRTIVRRCERSRKTAFSHRHRSVSVPFVLDSRRGVNSAVFRMQNGVQQLQEAAGTFFHSQGLKAPTIVKILGSSIVSGQS